MTKLGEDGFTLNAHFCSSGSFESAKQIKLTAQIRLIEQPAPSEKSIRILLTSDDISSFFYCLDISETDYQTLRQRQGLLVDLASFPSMVHRLLEACRNDESATNPKFSLVVTKNSSPGRDTAMFEIQETNTFRRLVHLSLEMRQGTDAKVRDFLADKLSKCQNEFEKVCSKLESANGEISSLTSEMSILKTELERLHKEKNEQESILKNQFHFELAEERKYHNTEMAALKLSQKSELENIIEEHRSSIRQLQNQTASLEYENKDLSEKRHRYEATIQTLSEEKRIQSDEIARLRKELEQHKEQNNYLGAGNHELDRNLTRLEAKLALAEEEKSRLAEEIKMKSDVIQELNAQKKKLTLEIEEKSALVSKREEAVKNVSRELLKANDVIKKLQEQNRKLNNKVKMGFEVVQEQERILSSKEEEIERIRQDLKNANEKVIDHQATIRQCEHEMQNGEKKIEELQKKNRTDETVIQWLNKQLTFAQSRDPGLRLAPPPEVLATSMPLAGSSLQQFENLGLETPKSRSQDKENSQSHSLDPKYLQPSATSTAIRPKSSKNSSQGASAASPSTAGLLRSAAVTTNGPLKSKNQQSVYFSKT